MAGAAVVLHMAPPPPAFTASDQLAAVRAVCGAAKRGTATDNISTPAETVSGFVSADGRTLYMELLSASYEVGGVARHAVVFGGHYVEDGTIDSSQGATTEICAAVLERRGGKWTPVMREPSLTETGFNGRNPSVALQTIATDRHVIEITQSLWNSGSAMTVVTLYEPEGTGFKEVLSAATAADDCGAGEKCFRFEGSLAYAPAPAPRDPAAAKDLHLILTGTYRNEAGRIVKIPAGPLVLRLTNGTYAPVSRTPATQALWKAVQSPWGE